MSCDLSIVMPAHNEEACIDKVVLQWAVVGRSHDPSFEMIVVDDGSQDSTGEILDRLTREIPHLRVIHQGNQGHGAALRRALEESCGQWIFHVDSDDQLLPDDFDKLWEIRGDYDYICGYRVERRDALHRLIISWSLRALNLVLFRVYLRDANVPFKLIRRAALQELLQTVPRGVFAPGIMMALGARRRFRFVEVPIGHRARRTGRVSIIGLSLLKACWRCGRELRSFHSKLR